MLRCYPSQLAARRRSDAARPIDASVLRASPSSVLKCSVGPHTPRATVPRAPAPTAQRHVVNNSRPTVVLGTYMASRDRAGEEGLQLMHTGEVPFKKLMAANRGEIAVRIFRAGTELGLRTCAVYSPADRLQPHRYKADEAYQVGSADMPPVSCYLDIDAIIRVAKEAEVDCIHPGYGFLSENAAFARKCAEAGITFVGPLPETIESMGDKTAARRAAVACGVPVVPGTNEPIASPDEAKAFAAKHGYPVILKAAMGGGGRGMRVVRNDGELSDAFVRASNEAKSAFGDGRMFIERYVEEPRHIEIQILADNYGNVVHLYERDCSVQRRHQKVVEMAPSYNLSQAVRQALFRDAVKLAKHVGYRNAGTVEFMVSGEDYYFLEVNPRVQVEHTVTEEITGVDIVQSQIKIAGGASLADLGFPTQEDVPPVNGFAIQCRVTSEDPEQNFQPDSGRLEAYRVPGGPGIRMDGAVTTGNVVSRYYDSLLAKVIASAPTFQQAVQKQQRALSEFQIRGIKTNIPFLENVLRHPEFLAGNAKTSFIEKNSSDLFNFEGHGSLRSSKLLSYLANIIVNGPEHPGATGPAAKTNIVAAIPSVPVGAAPPPGWRDVFVKEGAEGWARAVRKHKGVLITDTTMRDAHQSLLATRMRTIDMVNAAPATAHLLSRAGSLEMWGGATFDVALRFLHECPWKRLEKLRELIPNVPFQMLIRGANAVGYTSYPDNAVNAFVAQSVKSGVDIFRVFDSLNYVDNLKFGIDSVVQAGGIAEATLCYSGDVSDPARSKYSLDYYVELADQLVAHGVHALAIKDMAGLLKPAAATQLVGALRQRFPDTVIHVHTHDSAGTGVATQLAAAAAGADMIDCCMDSFSGMTSQPSMGAIVNSLHGTHLDTGIDPKAILPLSTYWEHVREMYATFESNMKAVSSDVYVHEMPGGQYTNLKFQASSLGLGSEWDKICVAYANANTALGDIIKVTPSSKVVGDLAQFMVQNNVNDPQALVDRAETLSFPSSVVEYFQGYLGQPPGGFPEPLRSRVLKGKQVIQGRPGASLAPLDLPGLEYRLKEKFGSANITKKDVLSAAMYPKVFDEYMGHVLKYSDLVEKLPTRAFLAPLNEDEEIEVEITKGVSVNLKFKAKGELQPSGKREVFFEANGVPRVIEVVDKAAEQVVGKKAVRERADLALLGSVGAPMAGTVIEVCVKPGSSVSAGQQLVVLSAMKMETAVCAPVAGTITQVAVEKNDTLDAGDLIVYIDDSTSSPQDNPLITVDSGDEEGKKGGASSKPLAAVA